MMKMKYIFGLIIGVSALLNTASVSAQQVEQERYRRHSLCSMLVKHTEDKYANEIEEQFLNIPIGEQYNDHNLSVRVVTVDSKGDKTAQIKDFVDRNYIPSRLVAKWFNRNILTGECDMELVKERGLYDASAFDVELANRTARGTAMLADAGEDLIGNTYLLMNEITYVDKAKRSRMWGNIFKVVVAVAMVAGGASADDALNTGDSFGDLIASYKGFSVKINTRLFRLNWNEEQQGRFYNDYYTAVEDQDRRYAFEGGRSYFTMEYVGNVVSKGGTTSFLGINEDHPELMIRKACQRALDENIADLGKKYEQFRIKAPITTVKPTITVQIGMKEGIDGRSKFEVLEKLEKDGKVNYHRVGVIRPVPGKIWDNRFMASEEGATAASLGATTFVKVSGGDFLPGMLVRQID